MEIKLNFVNNSNDANNSQVVIFQKNVASNFDEVALAWHVITSSGQGDSHPFTYPMNLTLNIGDTGDKSGPPLTDQSISVSQNRIMPSGEYALLMNPPATTDKEVQIRNDLAKGAINASIYKDGKLLAVNSPVTPEPNPVSEFKPSIWIGVSSEIEEGEVMQSAIISNINTELSLLGIASADIVMSGGGTGSNSIPYTFTLENIVMA